MSHTPRIAIVGGGFTGAAAAIELLRTLSFSFDLVLVEPDEQLGRGLAYGRAESFHLLNVRAGRLGVFADRPGDFASWARNHSFGIRHRTGEEEPTRAFLPRQLFGTYVESRLGEAITGRPDVGFRHARTIATGVRRSGNGFEVAIEGDSSITASAVILATGYGASSRKGSAEEVAFAAADREDARSAGSALFIGTGLTFVDEFLRLMSRGFRGEVIAVSRHGLLPEVHRANEAPKGFGTIPVEPKLATFLELFRRAMRRSELPALAAVDLALGVRPRIQPLWQSLDVRQQRRFLRHLRAYWNVVRHRMPPETYAQVRHAIEVRSLRVITGRVRRSGDGLYRIEPRREPSFARRFDLVFDCTGYRPKVDGPLFGSLVRQGLARHDAHRLGLSVAADGALVERSGMPIPGLFALGPLGHGTLYEITAVQEIVAQCASMAQTLQAQLRRSARRLRPDLQDLTSLR